MITPKSMAYFTEDGKTPDGHLRLAFHKSNLFNEQETEKIKSSVTVLERFFTNLNRLDGVRAAYQEFKDELKNLDRNNPDHLPTIDRRFRAFILEWKLFLDHFQRYIENGAQTGCWKTATDAEKREYLDAFQRYFNDVKDPRKQSDAFNLAAVIRNHIQHAYDAIDHTDGKKVYISREKVSSGPKVTASQKAALGKQPEFIDLETVADNALVELEKIHEQLLNFMVDSEVAEAAAVLTEAYSKIVVAGIKSDRWVICGFGEMELEDKETGKTLTQIQAEDENYIPFELETGMVKSNFTVGTLMSYIPLKWTAYSSFASLLVNLWKKGVWKDIQEKYFTNGTPSHP